LGSLNKQILRILLDLFHDHAYLNSRDQCGTTPLLLAVHQADSMAVELLLDYSADATLEFPVSGGLTVFDIVVQLC
jgi:ankyrin repeat protein